MNEPQTDFEINVVDHCNIVLALSSQIKMALGLGKLSNDEYFLIQAKEMNDTYFKFMGCNDTLWEKHLNDSQICYIRASK